MLQGIGIYCDPGQSLRLDRPTSGAEKSLHGLHVLVAPKASKYDGNVLNLS